MKSQVNYRDPNMNIAMPVFSIHGNHDDPSGLGGFSCLDSLHSTGLINYFGRINNLEEVRSMNDNEIYRVKLNIPKKVLRVTHT